MKAWKHATLEKDFSGLVLTDVPEKPPGRGQIAVRLKAAALNFRDILIARGTYPFRVAPGVVPLVDGCWEIVAVGEGVRRLREGDRIANCSIQGWIDGPLKPWMRTAGTFGADIDGTLTQVRLLDADMAVRLPATITDVEGATLTCAGLTAWSTLMAFEPRLLPGQTVLTLGTGAVSLFVVQFAKAFGARVIVTSSNDAKLDRAKALGADIVINYLTTPDWDVAVRAATGGEGAHIVVEPGGPPPPTITKSLASVALGGRVAFMGTQGDPSDLIHPSLVFKAFANLHGVNVGSRRNMEDMVAAISVNQTHPVIDRVYEFNDGAKAFRYFAEGKSFGKVVITG